MLFLRKRSSHRLARENDEVCIHQSIGWVGNVLGLVHSDGVRLLVVGLDNVHGHGAGFVSTQHMVIKNVRVCEATYR